MDRRRRHPLVRRLLAADDRLVTRREATPLSRTDRWLAEHQVAATVTATSLVAVPLIAMALTRPAPDGASPLWWLSLAGFPVMTGAITASLAGQLRRRAQRQRRR